jgi:nicotinamidase-related amidase
MSAPTALLLIDTQANMFDPTNPVASAEDLLERLRDLLARARDARIPIVFVRNAGGSGDPDERGTPGWQLHPSMKPAPGDLVLDKTTCDTFQSTPLGRELEARGVERVVIAGLQSEYCVRETALGALDRDLAVVLVADGHSTYDGSGRTAAEITAGVNAELADRVTLVSAGEVRLIGSGAAPNRVERPRSEPRSGEGGDGKR